MECYCCFFLLCYLQPAFIDKLYQKISVMNYFIMTAKLRVLVLQHIEAMRTCCYDLFYVVVIQCRDIVFHQHLSKILVSNSACRITSAFFFCSKDCKFNSCFLHQLCKGLRHLCVTCIECSGTTHPKENLCIL